MKKLFLIFFLTSFYSFSQDLDFYEYDKIIADTTYIEEIDTTLNVFFHKNLSDIDRDFNKEKTNFLIVYFNKNKNVAVNDINSFKDEYLQSSIRTRSDYFEYINELHFYITDNESDLQKFNIKNNNKPSISIIDNNLNILYKIDFKEFNSEFLNVFEQELIYLHKLSSVDKLLESNTFDFTKFVDIIYKDNDKLYNSNGITMMDKNEAYEQVKIDKYWNVEENYSIDIFKYKTSINKFYEAFYKMFDNYSVNPTDYKFVEILLSELSNNGFSSKFYRMPASHNKEILSKFFNYILKYDLSKYDKPIIGFNLNQILYFNTTSFTGPEIADYFKKTALFSNFNNVLVNQYVLQEENIDLNFINFVNTYIDYIGNDLKKIELNLNVLNDKFKKIELNFEHDTYKFDIAEILNYAVFKIIKYKKVEFYQNAVKWNSYSNEIKSNYYYTIAINAILNYRLGNIELSKELKNKALKIANIEETKNIDFILEEIK